MSVATKIAKVMRKVGRPMELRRTGVPDVTVYGTTDGAVVSRLLGIITETGTHVIFSNAEIAAATWPGPPKKEDRIIVDGAPYKIAAVEPKYLGAEILVFVCQIVGLA